MKTLELWLWRITDPVTGRRYTSRHRMTEADALSGDPTAERMSSSLEVRLVDPDGVSLNTSSFMRAPRSGPH